MDVSVIVKVYHCMWMLVDNEGISLYVDVSVIVKVYHCMWMSVS